MANYPLDDTQAFITCSCGEVMQVLKYVMVHKTLEIMDVDGNIIGYEEVDVEEAQWDEEKTAEMNVLHYAGCKDNPENQ